jgi:hypothetical protein
MLRNAWPLLLLLAVGVTAESSSWVWPDKARTKASFSDILGIDKLKKVSKTDDGRDNILVISLARAAQAVEHHAFASELGYNPTMGVET